MELQLKIIGIILIFLSFVHAAFPTYFHWKQEFKTLSLINKQMMYVHTFFIAFGVLLMGLMCLCCTNDLLYTPLGRSMALGLSIFWGARLIFQFFIYSPKLWKNKPFETVIHLIFSMFWGYISLVFLLIYLM
ncbi:MAG: hypothetical protein J7621_12485 [Niastella sp.]|nr:hypothetical protein [Niastella sp.]